MYDLVIPIRLFQLSALFYGLSVLFVLIRFSRSAVISMGVGLLINLLSDIHGRYLIWPYCNMFNEPFFLPLFLSFLSLYLLFKGIEREGLLFIPLVFFFSLIAIFCFESYYPPFTMMSKSIYSHLFNLSIFISHGLLIGCSYLAFIYLIRRDTPDHLLQRLTVWGFSFLSISGMFGMIWSYLGRADPVSWNHYYFHSIAIWFFYVGYLHLRLLKEWNDHRSLWILIGGALLILYFDYLPQIGRFHLSGVLDETVYRLY